jgi:hypothetical protein
MTMSILRVYEQYFTPDELARLPFYNDEAVRAQWQTLVEQASGLMQSGVAPDAPAARAFALRWLDAFEHNTNGDAGLQARLNTMAAREQEAVGLPAPLMEYVFAAIGAIKYALWLQYLRPEVVARMRRHHATRGQEWTGLIEQVQVQKAADPAATAPHSRSLARQWLALFHDMIGTDQDDIDAFRRASAEEPLLRAGAGIKDDTLDWLKRGLAPA